MSTNISKTIENPFLHFLFYFAANVLIFVTALGGLMDVLPPRMDWISKIAFPLCIVSGFVTSLISINKTKEILPSREAVGKASIITIISLLILIAIYAASFAIRPTQYVTIEEFKAAGLNSNQVAQLQEYLNTQGYISIDNMDNINLSLDQKNAVIKVLNGLGYTTKGDVESISKNIARTEISLVATQTAVAKATSCNVTPDKNITLVSIRKSNSADSDYTGSLASGQTLHVIGHDGGTVNEDRWWLVEQNIGGETVYGWVASWVVKEINEVECMRVEQAPGSVSK